jgi:DNA-directed RNA polymerase specialized sigma24 family protein
MKHEEIAEHLQISRHTVKTHLVQALKTLREVLLLLLLYVFGG